MLMKGLNKQGMIIGIALLLENRNIQSWIVKARASYRNSKFKIRKPPEKPLQQKEQLIHVSAKAKVSLLLLLDTWELLPSLDEMFMIPAPTVSRCLLQ